MRVAALGSRGVRVAALVAAGLAASAYGMWQWETRSSVQTGMRLLTHGDGPAAVRALLHAVADAPEDPHAHYYLGLAYARMGQDGAALNQLEDAVRLAPNDARFHDGLGRVRRAAGDPDLALAEFEAAAGAEAREPRYQVHAAGVLLDEGRVGSAIERLHRAVELAPESPEVHLVLAEALRRLGDRASMVREYQEAGRLAGDRAIGEVARQELRSAELDGAHER